MKVELKRDWFDPSSTRRRRGVVEIPDEYRDQLPSDAVEVDGETPLRRANEGLVRPQLPKSKAKDVTDPKKAAHMQSPAGAEGPRTAGGAMIPAQVKTPAQVPHEDFVDDEATITEKEAAKPSTTGPTVKPPVKK